MRVFIDIAEEYKTTILGDHRQEKKKRKKDTPGWIGTSTRRTLQLDSPEERHTSTLTRLDWGINTGKTQKLQGHSGRSNQDDVTTNLLLPKKIAVETRFRVDKKSRKPDRTTPARPPPCGICRRSAAAPTIHHPTERKPPNPDLSQAVSSSPLRRHNARGPRHTRRWTSSSLSSPCRRHRTWGPRHVRHSTLCRGSVP